MYCILICISINFGFFFEFFSQKYVQKNKFVDLFATLLVKITFTSLPYPSWV